MKKQVKELPTRSEIDPADCWDLSSLFTDDAAWEKAFKKWESQIPNYAKFRSTLSESPKALAACLKFDEKFNRSGERLGTYASLKTSEDATKSEYQRMWGRFIAAASRADQAASFMQPEILAVAASKMKTFLADKSLARYRLELERLLRRKPHTLSQKEERLLAMQTEMSRAASQTFQQLNNADLKFGSIKNEKSEWIELTHASFATLLQSPKRSVRKKAFETHYRQYEEHQYTLAATLEGSMQRDVYYARVRNHPSAREAALFPDRVPVSVYDNLIESIHQHLPTVHRYYDVRRRKMKLRDIHAYDTYVPILSDLKTRHTWDQAVDLVLASLEPLGSEYCDALAKGFRSHWCDRFENRGKQSGAFSCGSFDGDPYILMNYQEDVLDHVFTLSHEAGHSMHSYFSAKHQTFPYYQYVIFVAEVASTFNEELLCRYMMDRAKNDQHRAYLINRQIDAVRGTIFRQTMFAEFEKITHAQLESGEPLTVDRFREIYRELLEQYFGPDFSLDEPLSLECFRIPHFYRAFYVYKYATGLSAAMTLAERVLDGGKRELADYLKFLKGGGSKDPLDLLRDAGVDMEQPAAVDTAMARFGRLVDELDSLI